MWAPRMARLTYYEWREGNHLKAPPEARPFRSRRKIPRRRKMRKTPRIIFASGGQAHGHHATGQVTRAKTIDELRQVWNTQESAKRAPGYRIISPLDKILTVLRGIASHSRAVMARLSGEQTTSASRSKLPSNS